VLSVAMAVLAAYSLARLRFKGQRSFSLVVLLIASAVYIRMVLPKGQQNDD